ncbi:MAG: hypothetical protein DRN01_02010 [Thermoplasmata archaeon]|nr:MAG: hypothetical protein DRN01_02010 [Thermoplasmata archaeon]
MGNNLLFKALSSETRLSILKLLAKKEMHLSELARRLKYQHLLCQDTLKY